MTGRLTTIAAAMVVARRDFTAILFSRSFLFFLIGPLFPVLVGAMAGGVGQRVNESSDRAVIGVAMQAQDADAVMAAGAALSQRLGRAVPAFVQAQDLRDKTHEELRSILDTRRGEFAAILSGTPRAPLLTGPVERTNQWRGVVSLVAAQAAGPEPRAYPQVAILTTSASPSDHRRSQLLTAQAAQTMLFLLTMLLAGMVLSNLVEEKGNKIIEVLAAAIPMDALFFGKLFAMLAISFVGIAVWALAGGALVLMARQALPSLPEPAVGWAAFLALGVAYFSMAYLLLGSLFLAIGSLASTVREVQTLSMPVTMMQLVVFFLASYAMTQPGTALEAFAIVFPFSSPFSMLARAALEGELWPHAVALGWQSACVLVFVRTGARLFRLRVLKTGSGKRVRAVPAT